MSDSDASNSVELGMAANASGDTLGRDAGAAASQAAPAMAADPAGEWDQAGTDPAPISTLGFDTMSAGTDDWFPGAASGLPAHATLMDEADDPLVSLPCENLAASRLQGGALDDGGGLSGFAQPDANASAGLRSVDVMVGPSDYGMPVDHIEWHFASLLNLA